MRTQQTSPRMWVTGLFLLILLGLLLIAYRTEAEGQRAVAISPLQTQLQPFVGRWYAHGGMLTVNPDGDATLIARTYRWCGPGVASPCDSMQGNIIVSGINEQLQLTSVTGPTAYGKVIAGTGQNLGKPVTLSIADHDTLNVSGQGVMCGPQAPVGFCGA